MESILLPRVELYPNPNVSCNSINAWAGLLCVLKTFCMCALPGLSINDAYLSILAS